MNPETKRDFTHPLSFFYPERPLLKCVIKSIIEVPCSKREIENRKYFC